MFENEYKMDIRRYQRWTTPIFYKVLSFWPWLFIFLLSTVGAIIFYKNDLPMRWKSLALMLMLISVYRSVLFRFLHVYRMGVSFSRTNHNRTGNFLQEKTEDHPK